MNSIRPVLACCMLTLLTPVAQADEPVPRVLILGDTVYNQVSRSTASLLKGRVDVVWKHPGDTSSALARIDELLGDEKWDLIHFNFGLADLHYKDPRTEETRAMSKYVGGVRVSSPEQYAKNLNALVERLQATGAKLVWASTTPIVGAKFDNLYDLGSEIQYNAIAAKIMAAHKIPINDMHAYLVEQIGDKNTPDMFSFRGIELHPPVARSILAGLGLPELLDQEK